MPADYAILVNALLLALILALVHLFSERYARHAKKFHIQTISFSAGLFLGLIFLYLLPEFFKGMDHIGEGIYFLMLAGFACMHLGEKYIYQHVKDRKEKMQDLASIHALGFFVNHFIVGITLFLAFRIEGSLSGFLIFMPLLLHAFSSSLSLNEIDKKLKSRFLSWVVLPLSPMIGVAFAYLLNFSPYIYHLMFSFVLGTMLYIAVRDTLPRNELGKPIFFATGVMLSVLVILLISVA
jgi:zinc transporter ZupT